MCIVAIKPIGIKLPKKNILENCFINNPDGCGYMFVRNGKVKIRKGFLKFDEFFSDYKKQNLSRNDVVVFHFRIATSGDTNKNNTHPFPISNDVNELIKTENECEIGIAHNGILSNHGLTIGQYKISDTMEFILNTLSASIVIDNLESPSILSLIENRIMGSRIVILKKDSSFSLLGNGWKEEKKIIFSNDGYKEKKIVYFSNSKSQYPVYSYGKESYKDSSYLNYYDDFDFDDSDDSLNDEQMKETNELIEFDHDENYVCPICKNEKTTYKISDYHEVYECDSCLTIFSEGKLIYPLYGINN